MRDPIVTITARTGAEPELRYLNDGTALTTVRAAVTDDRPDGNGGWIENHTTWYDVAWFGKAAEHVSDLGIGKGDLIRVTGSLFLDDFTRKDGTTGSALKLRADGTPKHWPKGERGEQSGTGRAGQAAPPPAPETTSSQGGAQPQELGYRTGGAGNDYSDPPF